VNWEEHVMAIVFLTFTWRNWNNLHKSSVRTDVHCQN